MKQAPLTSHPAVAGPAPGPQKFRRLVIWGLLAAAAAFLGACDHPFQTGDPDSDSRPAAVEAALVIGPEGGRLTVTDSSSRLYRVQVDVPPMALSEEIPATIRETRPPQAPPPEESVFAGPVVRLQPDRTVLGAGVRLTMPYADEDLDGIVDHTGLPASLVTILAYDERMARWVYLEKVAQDRLGRTVTARIHRLGIFRAAAVDPDLFGSRDLMLFTVSGLKISKFLPEMPDAQETARPAYLKSALIDGFGLGLNEHDVAAFGDGPGESWTGDAERTRTILPDLVTVLQSRQHLAATLGRSFGLITHSWGTVLGYLALAYSDVTPDVFMSLSSPLGVQNRVGPWDFSSAECRFLGLLVESYLDSEAADAVAFMEAGPGMAAPANWINYWSAGDFSSGPVCPGFGLPSETGETWGHTPTGPCRDSRVSTLESCSLNTFTVLHAVTSLDEAGYWKNWLDDPEIEAAKAFRQRVKADLLAALNLDAGSFPPPASASTGTP